SNGLLRADPIKLSREKGTADATIELSLDKPKEATVSVKSSAWPVALPSSSLLLAVDCAAPRLDVDFTAKPSAGGPIKARALVADARFVPDKPPTEHDEPWNVIQAAGGEVGVWARLSREVDRRTQSHLTISFNHLDLDQLVHAASPEAEPMPGKLTGTFMLF